MYKATEHAYNSLEKDKSNDEAGASSLDFLFSFELLNGFVSYFTFMILTRLARSASSSFISI